MCGDLMNSPNDRRNTLNHPYALARAEAGGGVTRVPFECRSVLLKEQSAAVFGIRLRTVGIHLENFADGPWQNWYALTCGKRFQQLKLSLHTTFGHEAHFVTKTTVPGMPDFPAFHSRRKIAASLALAKDTP